MNHQPTHNAAACTAALALAMLLSACADGMHANASSRATPVAAAAFGSGEYLPSQYPAPQGEATELPPQF